MIGSRASPYAATIRLALTVASCTPRLEINDDVVQPGA
jgi:hypothetical protein